MISPFAFFRLWRLDYERKTVAKNHIEVFLYFSLMCHLFSPVVRPLKLNEEIYVNSNKQLHIIQTKSLHIHLLCLFERQMFWNKTSHRARDIEFAYYPHTKTSRPVQSVDNDISESQRIQCKLDTVTRRPDSQQIQFSSALPHKMGKQLVRLDAI